jgi:tRNA U38,U39,U40 pseudouridine synthase TruA
MQKTKWDDLFKIKIANSGRSFHKHEIIKLLIVMKLMERHQTDRKWIRIYTEYELENGNIPDVYMENLKEKSIIIYKIQKQLTDAYIKQEQEKIKKIEEKELFFKSIDLVVVPLKLCPDNIEEMDNFLEDYIL